MVEGIYIHIPFCQQICHYCDFNKVFIKNQPVDEYIEALNTEITIQLKNGAISRNPKTIFLGGGTPTALNNDQLSRLMDIIQLHFDVPSVVEFSSEANPDDLTQEKMQILKEGGVNRLSIGVQSFHPELLKKIGRTHSNEGAVQTIQLAKENGFQNLSIDLMYGLPGQTLDDWNDTLDIAIQLDLPHYSAYSLIIEPKTVFYNLMNKGKLRLPGEDLEAEMYDVLMRRMEGAGKKQYEISNFAQEGYESLHNLIYWKNETYAGIGAGAHGYINGTRYSNVGPLKRYIGMLQEGQLPILQSHEVPTKEKIEEELFLGLRKMDGVSSVHFKEKFNRELQSVFGDKIEKLIERGLLEWYGESLKLTQKGKYLGNEVFQEFLISG